MKERHFGPLAFIAGLLSGVAVGVMLGILLAPRSGIETRGRIANRATDIRSTASDILDQARHSIEVAASQVERVVGLQERNLRKKLDEISAQLEEYHLNEV
ncbi:MAG TPA: YtxH domain-containing protein [Anaerolineae bacterium]|jgi:gas vesicle protein|nr:YtxH domain-containing protein [Anaerolineae bacterium]